MILVCLQYDPAMSAVRCMSAVRYRYVCGTAKSAVRYRYDTATSAVRYRYFRVTLPVCISYDTGITAV